MSDIYKIEGELRQVPDSALPALDDANLVIVLGKSELDELIPYVQPEAQREISSLIEEEACYASMHSDYVVGSLAIPNKDDAMGKRELLAFYWRKGLLTFIDEGSAASETLRQIAKTKLPIDSTAACLQMFIEELLFDDTTWLGEFEDKLEAAEEQMLEDEGKTTWREIVAYRRITVRMSTYYEQLAEMASVLHANQNGMMTREESEGFESIVSRIDRLLRRAEAIREHSLALRELHQTQIEVQQNNTIQLLTVVTIIIAPIELITGWFGMNFVYLPGIDETWGLPAVCIFAALITLLLIAGFRSKRWI